MSHSFFNRIKELVQKKGRFNHKTEFVGKGDLSGDIFYHTSTYKYKIKNLKFRYITSAYDDGSEKEEELEIKEKEKGLFAPYYIVHAMFKKEKEVTIFAHLKGDWEKTLEVLLAPKQDL